ncbi:MAG: methylamine utilization protein [Methylotenera sp.]
MINKTFPLIFGTACLFSTASIANAGELTISIKDGKGAMLQDAIITAMPLDAKNLPKDKPAKPIVDQVGKEFLPHVLPIYVNSQVSFPNNDTIRHHVYSFSPAKKFELPLYSGTPAEPVLFDRPGVIILGCNIHDWMLGYIYVSATPYFARSDKTGKASIKDLSEGEYTIKVWHPQMIATEESTGRVITIATAKAGYEEWQLPLKRAFKLPRNSVGRGFGY